MQRSTDRILTTHVGSLIRTRDIMDGMKARTLGQPYEPAALEAAVEHPELVALRIKNFARLVGKENVIAGADCGFAQEWDLVRVHPSILWAKLQSLVDGAALASMALWSD